MPAKRAPNLEPSLQPILGTSQAQTRNRPLHHRPGPSLEAGFRSRRSNTTTCAKRVQESVINSKTTTRVTSTDFAPESRPVDAFDSAVLRFAWPASRTESLEKWRGSAPLFWVCVELVEDVEIRKLQLDQDLTRPLKALPKWISCAHKRQSSEPETCLGLGFRV